MYDADPPRTPKWPFFLFDILLVAFGVYCTRTAVLPLGRYEILAVSGLFALAAWIGVLPFLRDHSAAVKLFEQQQLAAAAEQLGQLREVAAQVRGSTAQWQATQDAAQKTVAAAGQIAARMEKEAGAFTEFMNRADEQRLRNQELEIEKLRRSEGEFVQVLIHVLDHVFALWRAGVNSGQPQLAQQLTHFRAACLDVSRRVGLASHEARPGDAYDPAIHRLPDGSNAPAGARVAELAAPGMSYQGQGVRPILVTVDKTDTEAVPAESSPS